ncbi:hypothetical protein ACH4CE_37045 [Streptomyces gelaticus]|uniref:hypothetical protein n=1 Tax=Streptomyces gelaticus TaxID=285446 RepID=UPI003792DDA6
MKHYSAEFKADAVALYESRPEATINAFLTAVTVTGAQCWAQPPPPVLPRLADGSCPSVIGTVKVRVIDAGIPVTCDDGTVLTGSYRLVTTLTDARRHPAAALTGLHHECWEHEGAHYAVRPTILHGHVMCSNDPAGLSPTRTAAVSPWPSRPPAARSSRPPASSPTRPTASG